MKDPTMSSTGSKELEDCSGCTDPRSEGTHQGHSKQHPCPEEGNPNCGYCFPETPAEGWAEEVRKFLVFTEKNGRRLWGGELTSIIGRAVATAEKKAREEACDFYEKNSDAEVDTWTLNQARELGGEKE